MRRLLWYSIPLILLAACQATPAAPEQTRTPGAVLTAPLMTNTPLTASPTPFVWPEAPPTSLPCENSLPSRLIPGERGRVTDDDPTPVNMRQGPRTSFELAGQIPARALFVVLEGPQCSERYTWYRVRYNDLEGWIAEGDNRDYYVEPYPAE
jgi:hypothetical protein